jgi:hypothetical protein
MLPPKGIGIHIEHRLEIQSACADKETTRRAWRGLLRASDCKFVQDPVAEAN